MSVFTSRVTQTIDIPGDPGQTATIRKLAPKHLEKAAKVHQAQAIEDLRALGGPAVLKELADLRETNPDIAAAVSDPLSAFDRTTLLQHGVVAWSYADAPTSESLEDLNDEVQETLARAVLKLAKPGLFLTEAEAAVARKNG